MLEILTAATETDLVELATVKAHLRPAPAGTLEDARLGDLIRWASAAISRYCRRTFARQKYRETLPGSGTQLLMLSRTPIEAVLTMERYGTVETDYRIEDAAAGFLWRLNGWELRAGFRGHYGRRVDRTAVDRDGVMVEYWAGYLMPGQTPVTGAYALPDDIEAAAALQVQRWYSRGLREQALGLASTSTTESEGEVSRTVSASYTPLAQNLGQVGPLDPEVAAMLKGYRR